MFCSSCLDRLSTQTLSLVKGLEYNQSLCHLTQLLRATFLEKV